jgi:hypothetical protein
MADEIEKMQDFGSYQPVRRYTATLKPIHTKWVFQHKYNADGEIIARKARLVAKGFQQNSDFDLSKTYAPTPSKDTIRLLLATAASNDWEIHQMDM